MPVKEQVKKVKVEPVASVKLDDGCQVTKTLVAKCTVADLTASKPGNIDYNTSDALVRSGLSLDKCKKYFAMSYQFYHKDGMEVDLLPYKVIMGLSMQAESEHWKNKVNRQFGMLLEYKLNAWLNDNRGLYTKLYR